MNESEQTIFRRIFETITCFQDLDAAHSELLNCLAQWVGSDLVILARVQPVGQTTSTVCVHARTEQLRSAFQARFERHFTRDSLQARILGVPRAAFTMTGYMGDAAWRASVLYRNVFHHAGATDAVILLLRDPNGSVRWMGCFALGRQVAPRKDTLKMLESVAPQLCAGLENLAAWTERWKHAQAVEALLCYTQDMLVCVSQSARGARVVAATRAAQAALGLHAGISVPEERMQEFMDLAMSVKSSAHDAPRWLSPNGMLYRVSRETPTEARSGALVLIRLVAAGAPEPTRADDLRAANAAGLSSRESAVFAHMARGLGNREIAEALKISIDTVRAHLRNVFAKLNVSSRVEAINAVRRRMENPETLHEPSKSPIDRPAAVNNDTGRRVKRSPGPNGKTESSPHAIGITAQAT